MEGVIEGLQPPSNLESLEVNGYPGPKFPKNWMMRNDGSVYCSNLCSLKLLACENCIRLPPSLGKLPSLEELEISGMIAVTNTGHEFFGIRNAEYVTTKVHDGVSFPKLKTLKFHEMEYWEEWNMTGMGDDITIMPCLCSLELYDCTRLKALPHNLLQKNKSTPLRELRIRRCPILSQRYEKEKGEDYGKVSHIPKVIIDGHNIQLEYQCRDDAILPEQFSVTYYSESENEEDPLQKISLLTAHCSLIDKAKRGGFSFTFYLL